MLSLPIRTVQVRKQAHEARALPALAPQHQNTEEVGTEHGAPEALGSWMGPQEPREP